MTREEAIEILKDLWRTKHSTYLEADIRKALEMAIQALSQEPCDDAVSRLDKIRQIIAIPNSVIQEDVMKYRMICEVMNDDKSVS